MLFAIVFFWTPPHFWALALRYRDDYAAAGIPMLPVAKGVEAATRQILAYAAVVALRRAWRCPSRSRGRRCTPRSPSCSVSRSSWAPGCSARDPSPIRAIRFFTFSNTYLALLFAAVAVDTLVAAA